MHINRDKRPPGYRIKGRGHIDWQTIQGTCMDYILASDVLTYFRYGLIPDLNRLSLLDNNEIRVNSRLKIRTDFYDLTSFQTLRMVFIFEMSKTGRNPDGLPSSLVDTQCCH